MAAVREYEYVVIPLISVITYSAFMISSRIPFFHLRGTGQDTGLNLRTPRMVRGHPGGRVGKERGVGRGAGRKGKPATRNKGAKELRVQRSLLCCMFGFCCFIFLGFCLFLYFVL